MTLTTTFVHHRLGAALVASLGFVLGLGVLGGAASQVRAAPIAAAVLGVLSLVLMIGCGLTTARLGRVKRGVVNVSPDGLTFDDAQIPASEIVSAHFTPATAQRPSSVRIVGTNDRELGWIGVADHAEADRVLTGLGLPPEKTSAQFYALAKLRGGVLGGVVLVVVLTILLSMLGGTFGVPQLGFLSILPVVAFSAYFLPAQLHVGSDGLLYKTRLRPRFFPWREVRAVESTDNGICVVQESGERFEIPTTSRGRRMYEYERIANASLLARATDALRAFERGAAPDVSARVARLGRTKEQWFASLFDREGSFREAPLRSDDLWNVVESPTATVSARAGAAGVLSQVATEEDRRRLRIAADGCVEPRLRVVLDRAANGEDVMEVLGEIVDLDPNEERV